MLLATFALPLTDPVLIFAVVLLIILFAPLVFKRFRLPGLLGLILAGVLVGPHGLNILLRDQSIRLFGTVGLLYIMFIAGLEIDLNDFKKSRNKSLMLGILSFNIPQLLGTAGGYFLLGMDLRASILLACMLSCHTLLAYPVASKLGLSKTEAVTIAVGSTILADVCSLLILAITANAARGELGSAFWIQLIISMTAFLFIIFWGLPRIGRWFFRNIESEGVSQYTFVLAMVFISAFLAHVAGMEPIIGAFLAGLGLNRLIPHTSPLMNRIEFVGNALFIPFFLISVGMMVDLSSLLKGPAVWKIAGLMIVAGTVGKWLAAWLMQQVYQHSSLERDLIFGLSEARAAASLAVVLVGLELKILDEDVLNGTVLMILVTCLISTLVVENVGRKLAIVESQKVPDRSSFPNRILVPISNPGTLEHLIDFAIMIKDPKSDEPIFPLAVVRDAEDATGKLMASNKMLQKAIHHASATESAVQLVSRIDVNIAGGILRAIRELMITEVVIGWNGKITARERVFGSVLDKLLAQSEQLIMVCKILHPINTVGRLMVVVPANAELEMGFARWVGNVQLIARQVGAQIHFFGNHDTLARLTAVVKASKSSLEIMYNEFDGWNNLASLAEKLRKDDLFIVVSSRPGALSHTRKLDVVPRQLARHFSSISFVIVYPEQARDTENA